MPCTVTVSTASKLISIAFDDLFAEHCEMFGLHTSHWNVQCYYSIYIQFMQPFCLVVSEADVIIVKLSSNHVANLCTWTATSE